MFDDEEAVDYAGSDADDVISLGGDSQLDPLSEGIAAPEPASPQNEAEPRVEEPQEKRDDAPQAPRERSPDLQRPIEPDSKPAQVNATARPDLERRSSSQTAELTGPSSTQSRALSSQPAREVQSALPLGWVAKKSSSTGDTYYYNTESRESVWDRPEAPAHRSLAANAAASDPNPEKLTRGDTYRPDKAPARRRGPRNEADYEPHARSGGRRDLFRERDPVPPPRRRSPPTAVAPGPVGSLQTLPRPSMGPFSAFFAASALLCQPNSMFTSARLLDPI